MKRRLLSLAALAAAACTSGTATSEDAVLNREFTLRPGETATVDDGRIRVQFLNVPADSRCPSDVNCIQAGEAVVALTVASASQTRNVELRSSSKREEPVGAYRVSLERVEPTPRSDQPIPPNAYRASFKVTQQ